MKALQEHGFPVPNVVDCNRHCVIMSIVQGYPFVQVKQLQNPETVFEKIIGIIVRLAEHRLIHCDRGLLLGLTKALATELAPHTRVNCVAPGFIPTHGASYITSNKTMRKSLEEQTSPKGLGRQKTWP